MGKKLILCIQVPFSTALDICSVGLNRTAVLSEEDLGINPVVTTGKKLTYKVTHYLTWTD